MNTQSEVIRGHVISHILKGDLYFPNNEKFPLLVYKGALLLHPEDEPEAILHRFAINNWTKGWTDGIYDYHHYHSTTHEVIGVFCGTVDVQFGGDDGVCVELSRGDVVVIPAGVAHKNLQSSKDLLCAGAYPDGSSYDIKYGRNGERPEADSNVAVVPLPPTDPVYGFEGPLIEYWKV